MSMGVQATGASQYLNSGRSTPSPSSLLEVPQWDPSSERKIRAKVDFLVLPLLYLGFFTFQLDRMNIASALTGGFASDINVSQSTINLGNQLMYMGTVVFEIPCNMAQQKFGPRKWLSGQVFLFGLLGTLQVFIKNRAGFLSMRLLLGLVEAGYIPGAMYTLSTWYKNEELAKRVAIFFFGMFSGNALSPPLASGVLQLDGHRGIRGWQWLFIIEGIFTIFVSFLFLLLLPGSPDLPRPILSPGLLRFSEPERKILRQRLQRLGDGYPEKNRHSKIPLRVVWKAVLYYRRWLHYLSTFAVFSTWSPLTTYTPSIMMSLGFDRTTANALAAVGGLLALAVVFGFAYIGDLSNVRGGTVICAQVCYLITLIVALVLQPHEGKWSRWGLWTAVNGFAVCYHPVHNTWLQINCRDPRERSVSIALWVMFANSGMMVGTQYFQEQDKPFYQNGLRIMIVMVSVGIFGTLMQLIVYIVHNRRVAQGKTQSRDESPNFLHIP